MNLDLDFTSVTSRLKPNPTLVDWLTSRVEHVEPFEV